MTDLQKLIADARRNVAPYRADRDAGKYVPGIGLIFDVERLANALEALNRENEELQRCSNINRADRAKERAGLVSRLNDYRSERDALNKIIETHRRYLDSMMNGENDYTSASHHLDQLLKGSAHE